MEAVAKKPTKRSLNNKKNVIRPKVENGKVLLDRNNPLHRHMYNEGDPLYSMDEIQEIITKTINEKNLTEEEIMKALDYKRK